MTHAIGWFEIPATDFDRATEFYSTVLDRDIDEVEMEDGPYGLFRTDDGEIGGAIARANEYTVGDNETKLSVSPGNSGTTIYLTVDGDLNEALSEVESAGGEVVVGKEQLDDGGYYGVIGDTEGNQVGLISEN